MRLFILLSSSYRSPANLPDQWRRDATPLTKDGFGVWSTVIPAIEQGSRVKVTFQTRSGDWVDRIPAWITRAEQPKGSPIYDGVYWRKSRFPWAHPRPARPAGLKVYEVHIGISSQEPAIASYKHFEANVLPRIASLVGDSRVAPHVRIDALQGYNAVQIMAVMEHAYYGSFGYQVTSFFAISSRYAQQAFAHFAPVIFNPIAIKIRGARGPQEPD